MYVDLSSNDIHWQHPRELGIEQEGGEQARATEAEEYAGETAAGSSVVAEEATAQEGDDGGAPKTAGTSGGLRQEDPRREVMLQAVFQCGSNGKEEATLQEIVAAAEALASQVGTETNFHEPEVEALCNQLQDQNRVMIADGVVYFVV